MGLRLAFVGKARSGKDTMGNYVIKNYGAHRFAFGDPLKEYAKELFPQYFENGRKPRWILQKLGQAMREIDPDIWVRLTFNAIYKGERGGMEDFCLTDARQPNEIERLRKEGFILIRVNAPDKLRIQRMIENGDNFKPEDLKHETEIMIDTYDVDYEIQNNGNLFEAFKQLEIILDKIRG